MMINNILKYKKYKYSILIGWCLSLSLPYLGIRFLWPANALFSEQLTYILITALVFLLPINISLHFNTLYRKSSFEAGTDKYKEIQDMVDSEPELKLIISDLDIDFISLLDYEQIKNQYDLIVRDKIFKEIRIKHDERDEAKQSLKKSLNET